MRALSLSTPTNKVLRLETIKTRCALSKKRTDFTKQVNGRTWKEARGDGRTWMEWTDLERNASKKWTDFTRRPEKKRKRRQEMDRLDQVCIY